MFYDNSDEEAEKLRLQIRALIASGDRNGLKGKYRWVVARLRAILGDDEFWFNEKAKKVLEEELTNKGDIKRNLFDDIVPPGEL